MLLGKINWLHKLKKHQFINFQLMPCYLSPITYNLQLKSLNLKPIPKTRIFCHILSLNSEFHNKIFAVLNVISNVSDIILAVSDMIFNVSDIILVVSDIIFNVSDITLIVSDIIFNVSNIILLVSDMIFNVSDIILDYLTVN